MKPRKEAEADAETRQRTPASTLPIRSQVLDGYYALSLVDQERFDLYWRMVVTVTGNCMHYADAA